MKMSLAIVFAAVALMFGATVGLKSGAAIAHYEGYSGKSPNSCGVVTCAYPDQAPIPRARAQVHIAVVRPWEYQPASPWEAGWSSLEVAEAGNAEVHDKFIGQLRVAYSEMETRPSTPENY